MANRFRRVLEELGRSRSATPQRGLLINSNVSLSSSPANQFLKNFLFIHNRLIILKRPEGKCKYCCNDLTRFLQSSKGLKIFNCINERFSFNTFRIRRVLRPTFQIAKSFQVFLNDDDMKKNMQISNIKIILIIARSAGFIVLFRRWTKMIGTWRKITKPGIIIFKNGILPLLRRHCRLEQRRHNLSPISNTTRNLMSTTLDATYFISNNWVTAELKKKVIQVLMRIFSLGNKIHVCSRFGHCWLLVFCDSCVMCVLRLWIINVFIPTMCCHQYQI